MTITETELAEARAAWGNGLVAISTAYDDDGIEAARALAEDLLDWLYGFEFGPILFKPTLSGSAQTFRTENKAPCRISSVTISTTRRIPVSG